MSARNLLTMQKICKKRIKLAKEGIEDELYSFEQISLKNIDGREFDAYEVKPTRDTRNGSCYYVLLGAVFQPPHTDLFLEQTEEQIQKNIEMVKIMRANGLGFTTLQTAVKCPMKQGALITFSDYTDLPSAFKGRVAISCTCPDFKFNAEKGTPSRNKLKKRMVRYNAMYGCKHMMMVNHNLNMPMLPAELPKPLPHLNDSNNEDAS